MLKALLASAVVWGATSAAAQSPPKPADTLAVCVDVNGALLAANCRGQASRLQSKPDICSCPRGVRVEASICPANARPPPESPAVAQARREALRHQTSLVGASLDGRPLCVDPSRALGSER